VFSCGGAKAGMESTCKVIQKPLHWGSSDRVLGGGEIAWLTG